MKDALGHGSNKWSPYGASKVAKMYVSLNGRKDALVRTEPHISGANKGQYLWQHGNEVGHAGSVDSAKRAVEDRQAASQLASGPKSAAAPVHDAQINYATNPLGLSRSEVNEDGIPNINSRPKGGDYASRLVSGLGRKATRAYEREAAARHKRDKS